MPRNLNEIIRSWIWLLRVVWRGLLYIVQSEPVFWDGLWGEKIDSWNRVVTKYEIESALSHEMLIFKAGIDFSSLPTAAYCLRGGNELKNVCSHTQHIMMKAILKSSVPSRGIDYSKNQLHNWARIFKLLRSPRINSKEPIPPGCVAWRVDTTTLFLFGSWPP